MSENKQDKTNLASMLEKVGALADRFAERSAVHDREGTFPFDNFAELREAGYLALTVPTRYGGLGGTLYDMVVLQERLAQGDGATALSVGWHLSVFLEQGARASWKEDMYAALCRDVAENGRLINKLATEPATGSPARGGRPQTTAARTEDGGWRLNGRKTFSTMSEALDYLVVSASVEGEDRVGDFMIRKGNPGYRFEQTWDTLGMRGTCSHDLVLEDTLLPEEAAIELHVPKPGPKSVGGWLMHIPACYLGIARAARDYAVRFAASYSPNSTTGPIAKLPNVRTLVGKMDAELLTARHLLHAVAKRWDAEPDNRVEIGAEVATTKYVVVNAAQSIVDQAMRVVGGHSLYRSSPLERYYRDVRAGLYNPPADEMTLQLLASRAFQPFEG